MVAIPSEDFDPTEVAVPWKRLIAEGHQLSFTTPEGKRGHADFRMVTGAGLGPLKPFLRADKNGRRAYRELERDSRFLSPIAYRDVDSKQYDALILPGGHAPGMRVYLESKRLQAVVSEFFLSDKPVGAICHGVVLASRCQLDNRPVLLNRKTTALTKSQERTAWWLTRAWLGNYFRTYPIWVEEEVAASLRNKDQFLPGPFSIFRDSPTNLSRGFCVRDGNYLSARWPGDAHRFAEEFVKLLGPYR